MKLLLIALLSLIFAPVMCRAQTVGYLAINSGQAIPVTQAQPTNPLYISGTTTPTNAQITLAFARKAALINLNQQFSNVVAAGITVTTGTLTVTLAAQDSDREAFSQLMTTISVAPMPPVLTLADVNSTPFTANMVQIYVLLGSYGQQYASLWSNYVIAKANIFSSNSTNVSKISITNPTGT